MDLSTENLNGILIAVPKGRLDGISALKFGESLNASIDDSVSGVVIDMSELNYISSAGLRAVLLISKALQQKEAQLALCALQPPVREVFEVSGFDQIINIRDDRGQATSAVSQ